MEQLPELAVGGIRNAEALDVAVDVPSAPHGSKLVARERTGALPVLRKNLVKTKEVVACFHDLQPGREVLALPDVGHDEQRPVDNIGVE